MCGIIGIISHKPVQGRLLTSLKRLEYRGYDSSGISIAQGLNQVETYKSPGKIANLEKVLSGLQQMGTTGIAHTRWATHGAPSEANAHPHHHHGIALVHNGIIENHVQLRAKLVQAGYQFTSDTDSEVLVHLIDYERRRRQDEDRADLLRTVQAQLEGAYAIVILFADTPASLYGLKHASPLVAGQHDNGDFLLASDTIALGDMASQVIYLEDGDIALLENRQIRIYDSSHYPVTRTTHSNRVSSTEVSKGPYPHFMLKEIYEQPDAARRTLQRYIDKATHEITLPGGDAALRGVEQVRIIACGTSNYAGQVAQNWIEKHAGLPVQVSTASEFRYGHAPLVPGTLCIFISQSGETADTLAALQRVKKAGLKTVGIVNVDGSSIARAVDVLLLTDAGPEIGVATTKAFTAQLVVLAVITLQLARKNLDKSTFDQLLKALIEVPAMIEYNLQISTRVREAAKQLATYDNAIYVGRGNAFCIALEGALKLKEISYIHAEAYPAGELKHGPIALIDRKMPTIAVIPNDNSVFEKTLSNLEEIKARNGYIFAITNEAGKKHLRHCAHEVITVHSMNHFTLPFALAVPIQLLSYHTAVYLGTDVDQPRNLAKSVTVE